MEDNKNQKPLFGIIGGSSFLKSEYFANLAKINVETEHGTIILYKGENFVFCQRHGSTLTPYNPPHLIPNLAIAAAFSKLGVKQIIGFASVGSMKTELGVGTVVIPDDIFNIWNIVSGITDSSASYKSHFAPSFDKELRTQVIDLLKSKEIKFVDGGVYVQTTGPRFESRSEIKFLSTVGEIVGMTCANELTLFQEQGIGYALITMIDNMANGIQQQEISLDLFHQGVHNNLKLVESILGHVLERFTKN
eukprot:TRINITY_DN8236_c0_g1_i2.p1 TRINITY_DN8236_c0_g1~~TRINITY_DN8236_c0_g1_i2.p1  ORF type:complete len:249 (+),score=71.08 TRINITY_DN8236_c0_g1_i2:60-806(+)